MASHISDRKVNEKITSSKWFFDNSKSLNISYISFISLRLRLQKEELLVIFTEEIICYITFLLSIKDSHILVFTEFLLLGSYTLRYNTNSLLLGHYNLFSVHFFF